MPSPIVRFGTFQLDRATGELRSKGQRVPLQDQPAQLLAILVGRAGAVVTREELRKALWSDDTFVEFDTALNVAVNKVRQALRDSASSPRFVETVPRRGYRFVADVRPAEAETQETPASTPTPPTPAPLTPAPPRDWRYGVAIGAALAAILAGGLLLYSNRSGRAPAAESPRSVAILPFRPLAAEARDEALEIGMAEAVIVKLGQQRLRVPSIGAVQRYAGREPDPLRAGRELGVDTVLDCSLQRANGHLRVSARLLDVRSGASRWTQQWDLLWTDVFTVQDAIATQVARELAFTLASPEGPKHTTSPDLYDRYLRARYLVRQRTPEASRRAGELLEEVVKLDPGFAPAYAVLADAYLSLPWMGAAPLEPHLTWARQAAQRSLDLDPTGAEAHATLGTVLAQFDWDPVAGERELKQALELGPDEPTVLRFYTVFLWHEGRFEEALALNDHELALDPTSVFAHRNRAIIYYYSRRNEDCIAQSRKTIELDRHFITAYSWLSRAYAQLGRDQEAAEAFVQPLTFQGGRDDDVASLRAAAKGGMRAFWKRWLEIEQRQPEYGGTDMPALAWLSIGDRERALAELERLCDARSPWMRAIGVEPAWDPIRADPRFQALLRRVRLLRS